MLHAHAVSLMHRPAGSACLHRGTANPTRRTPSNVRATAVQIITVCPPMRLCTRLPHKNPIKTLKENPAGACAGAAQLPPGMVMPQAAMPIALRAFLLALVKCALFEVDPHPFDNAHVCSEVHAPATGGTALCDVHAAAGRAVLHNCLPRAYSGTSCCCGMPDGSVLAAVAAP